ncbi:MAG: NAD(+) synthase [Thermoflexibacter sp.]|jgi:NAD+ synthase (glutamine-hydrolysing)|nr:NAD(+) synthase [Thermoflexibacter sp.]
MKLIKVAGAVLNQTPLHWENNKQNIIHAIAEARKQKVSILCLPELCITGYGCEDAFYAIGVHQTALEVLEEILPYTTDMVVSVGLPILYQNRIFNTACLIVNEQIIGFVAKRFLAGNGIHYEPRWFTPWPEDERVNIVLTDQKGNKQSYPMGDIYYNIGGVKIGFEICEDAWVANRPGRKLYKYGIDLIMNPSASHFAFAKLDIRKRFVLEGSRAFGTAYIYSNLLGNEAGRAIYDGGTLIASSGSLVAVGERLTFDDYLVTSAVIDIADARMAQAQASTVFNVPEMQDNCIETHFSYPNILPEPSQILDNPWEKSKYLQEEEFARVQALGLFDYMRKSYSRGFVISLSGGADSSAITCCCYLMIKMGIESIGIDRFKKKLAYIKEIQDCQTAEQIAHILITTAYQPTENSSIITQNAALQVAKAVNAAFYELNVNNIFKEYTYLISKAIGREMSWQTDDIPLQNVQARVRSPSIWLIANLKNALLLSTSNRSEAAVGYATMDGDTSGGLSPIAGIDKAFLRQWLRWLEGIGYDMKGTEEFFKMPALKYVNEQQPTAELRPLENKQTDEEDLMPYDLLDAIEEAAIRDKKMPLECYILLQLKYAQYTKNQLKTWVIKFFRLWCRNQWKRERYAPSFHLDDKNLDPKTWCRFPILSGGFERELKALEAYQG